MENITIPIQFIDSMEERRHIALFYEDPEYARFVEFRFLKNGLAIGEQCIYATEQDSASIVIKMLRYGIPLEYFETKKIRVCQIHPRYGNQDEIRAGCKKDISNILCELEPPFRIVSRIVPDVSTVAGISTELELERETHNCFEDLNGSIMCPYDISKIESSQRKEWLSELYENHHEILYVPTLGKGGVFSAKGKKLV